MLNRRVKNLKKHKEAEIPQRPFEYASRVKADKPAEPTYTLQVSQTSVDEGYSVTFTLTTTNVQDGTLVPYTITGITLDDLSVGYLTGTFIMNENTASVVVSFRADNKTEGDEIAIMYLNNNQAYASVIVRDTSKNPTPTPTPSPTQTPSPTLTQTPTRTLTPSPTQTPSPTLTPSPTQTPSPTLTQTPTRVLLPTPTPSPTLTQTPTRVLLPTPTPTEMVAGPTSYSLDDPNRVYWGSVITSGNPDQRIIVPAGVLGANSQTIDVTHHW